MNITENGGLGQTATLTLNAGFANLDNFNGKEVDNPFVQGPFVQNPFVEESLCSKPLCQKTRRAPMCH